MRTINPIYADFEISERQLARLLEARGGHDGNIDPESEGAAATLILRETDHEIVGHIDSMDNTVDTSTGTIMVRATFPNPDARIFPGFFVGVRIAGEILKDALVVEDRAIGTDLGGKYIYVVERTTWWNSVTSSLVPQRKERYVVAGLLRARPGLPVTPKTQTGGE